MMNLGPEFFLRLALGLGLFAFGWTLFRFGMNAAGFGLGFIFGYSLYELLLKMIPQLNPDWLRFFPQHPAVAPVIGVVLGIGGIFLARRLFRVAIFLGIWAGSLYLLYATSQRQVVDHLFAQLHILEPLNHTLGYAWPTVLALLTAGLFLLFQKQIIIAITTCGGSFLITDTLNLPIFFLPLCFIGFLLQQKQKTHRQPRE